MEVTSNDGTVFTLSPQAVPHSNLLSECDADEPVPLLNVFTPTTACLVEILNFIGREGVPAVKAPVTFKLATQMGPLFDMLPAANASLVELWRAARYILCDDVVELVCAKLVYNTMHLSPRNIKTEIQEIGKRDLLPFAPELGEVKVERLVNSIERIKWLQQSGYRLSETTCVYIISQGLRMHGRPSVCIEVLKWARDNDCRWDHWVCSQAALEGHLSILEWARDNGCPWSERTCSSAAAGGHLDILEWLRKNGCPWDSWTCARAVSKGHVHILKWARKHECPWDAMTCLYAAERKDLETLEWLRKHGCPWNSTTCSSAASRGDLKTLIWARDNGCPWDSMVCTGAAMGGHVETLKWARSKGCPESTE